MRLYEQKIMKLIIVEFNFIFPADHLTNFFSACREILLNFVLEFDAFTARS